MGHLTSRIIFRRESVRPRGGICQFLLGPGAIIVGFGFIMNSVMLSFAHIGRFGVYRLPAAG